MRTRRYSEPKTGFFEFMGRFVLSVLGIVAVLAVGWLALIYIVLRWI